MAASNQNGTGSVSITNAIGALLRSKAFHYDLRWSGYTGSIMNLKRGNFSDLGEFFRNLPKTHQIWVLSKTESRSSNLG